MKNEVIEPVFLSQLERVRALSLPSREAMLRRDSSVQQFWSVNKPLLCDAWKEWEASEGDALFKPNESLLDSALIKAVTLAWQNPEREPAVRDLLTEVAPGVFQFQFFDPQRLVDLRNYLNAVAAAGIPLRAPYGIALNRRGAMLDPRSEGVLGAPSFQLFYRELMDKYMRPIARLLFPEIMGYDTQTFGFSIHYQPGVDTSLRLHTDASAATLNINMNLPNEMFSGSEVDFHDSHTGKMTRLTFKPGMAMIHRGNIAHAAQPITSGERSNLVLWLYGDHGQVPRNWHHNDAHQRWTRSLAQYDETAPF